MRWQVIFRANKSDKYVPPKSDREQIYVNLAGDASRGNNLSHNINSLCNQLRLDASAVTNDLLCLAMAVYCADKMLFRKEAYDNWSRDIKLEVPVSNKQIWENQKGALEQVIGFLSGDHWEFEFRKSDSSWLPEVSQPALPSKQEKVNVSLLSGGLDSLIGAIDLLENQPETVYFVSHHGQGGVLKPIQEQVINYLSEHYQNRFVSVQPFVQPPQSAEETQRSRTFLFISLGVYISDGLAKAGKLFMSENGFISLNVPLLANRVGSASTRTTHPFVVSNLQKIINDLGIAVDVQTPYKFVTKGEMLGNCRNLDLLKKGISLTRSCSKSDLRWKGFDPKGHCGICMPCLIRRASLRRAGLPEGKYLADVTSPRTRLSPQEKQTIRALKVFLNRFETGDENPLFALLSNGSIPIDSGEIQDYLGVFTRGLGEISELLTPNRRHA